MRKSLLSVLVILLTITSCNNAPDNAIHSEKKEQGNWVSKDGQKPEMTYDTYYEISPTWGQSMDYAEKRADRSLKVILSIICGIIFVGLFVGKASNASWFPEKLDANVMLFNALLFISLVGAVYFWFGDASGVKWNNDKWVKKEVYDEAMKTGSTKPIWDSLENNCLIVDGPYNCYTK